MMNLPTSFRVAARIAIFAGTLLLSEGAQAQSPAPVAPPAPPVWTAPPPPVALPLTEKRNLGLLVPAAIFLGLSPVAIIGGTAMVIEANDEDKNIGIALEVLGGLSFGFGLAGTIAGALTRNVEVDPSEVEQVALPVVRLGAGNASLTWSF